MFLEKVLIFVLFLGPLVFFHELGHFLFARLFGVRVEVFSIGFGPKILKYKKGDTEYALSVIPLGGYVKMFGDDPLNKEGVPESERKYAFNHKNKWERFWIVFGGPLANFIIAYIIFALVFLSGERTPELKFGFIPETSQLRVAGFLSGDRIIKINNKKVFNPTDIALSSDGHIKNITVNSFGKEKLVAVEMPIEKFFEEFSKTSPLRQPILVNEQGMMFVVSKEESGVNWDFSLEHFNDHFKSIPTIFMYQYLGDMKKDKFEKKVANKFDRKIELNQYLSLNDFFKKEKVRPLDMSIASIQMKSAADESELRSGDVILAIDNKEVFNFMTLRNTLQKTTNSSIRLRIWREKQVIEKVVKPKITKYENKELKLIGVHSGGIYMGAKYIKTEPKDLITALSLSYMKTVESIKRTFQGFIMLISAKVSLKNIGGPLSIGKVASDSLSMGISQFLQFMALMSVNLGVVNLFPIPVLDGGHIMFIVCEIFNRGPLSRRKMEIAQQVGLSLLMILMVGSIFNDVTKFF